MIPETPVRRLRLPVLPVALVLLTGAAGALFLARGVDLKGLAAHGMALIRGAGPWAFFGAAAVLPAVGAPLSAFTITAGELFAPTLTLPGVIAAMFFAIAVNLALTYWLARFAFRPLLSRIAGHYGYAVPRVTPSNALSITLALRLTPGTPFALQSYLLGLAEVPFGLYLLVSWLCQIPWHVGCIILGKGILNGNFKVALYGVGLLVVATVVIQQLRRSYASRSAPSGCAPRGD